MQKPRNKKVRDMSVPHNGNVQKHSFTAACLHVVYDRGEAIMVIVLFGDDIRCFP